MTPRLPAATITAGLLLALAACGSAGSPPPVAGSSIADSEAPASSPAATSPAPSTPASSATAQTATELAEQLAEAIPSAGKVTTITEDNDPNDLIGRPTGYTDAAVIEDESGECPDSGLGIDCGATIEIWATPEDAQTRADYIQGVLKGNSALGTEYHTVNGAALLRVSGKVKPSVAKEYAAAFTG